MKYKNIIILVFKSFAYFEKRRKFQLIFNLVLLIINAILELITINLTLSLFSVMTGPDNLIRNNFLEFLFGSSYNQNLNSQIYYVTFTFISVVLISTSLRLFNLRYSTYLAQNIGTDFCTLALKSFLNQDYNYHLRKNSADIISTININIDGSITAIDSFFQLISSLLISLSILFGLFNIDGKITLISVLIISFIYFSINIYSRRVFLFNSKKLVKVQPYRLRFIQEGLGAIREVILYNLQNFYVKNFDYFDRDIRKRMAKNSFVIGSIRFILEGVILLILSFCVLIIFKNNNGYDDFAVLATFAVAAQKLLPSMQTIYRMWSNLLQKRYQLIDTLNIFRRIKNNSSQIVEKDFFNRSISFHKLRFRYSDSDDFVLNSLSLKIFKGECIGIIGKSGSGKTTLIEILMTLLSPSDGKMFVDDIDIFDSSNRKFLNTWRQILSHVPQDIFISDSSVAENIAFGIPFNDIDLDKIKRVAKQAQLDSFIEGLPKKYLTFLGEGGSKLSGGQRQRIAIARALYRDAKVIILDEATSSLDLGTESNILALIKELKGKITFIIVAHRINTLSICDRIFKIKAGNINDILSPDELKKIN